MKCHNCGMNMVKGATVNGGTKRIWTCPNCGAFVEHQSTRGEEIE